MTVPYTYIPGFIVPDVATLMYLDLSGDLNWERRESAPRSEYWTNVFERPYTYGQGAGIRTYEHRQTHNWVELARTWLHYEHGAFLEGCFLNYYHDGHDALGWHADDDPKIDHSKPIAVITIGHGRDIAIKAQEKGSHPTRLFLEPGSLLLMHAGMQQTHFHSIPKLKESADAGGRISLTFRGLVHD
jgi:alkylated DNA repair dioxygenase AlkB